MRARRGFTLLEVLAAVAFVGLVFTALSRSATVGIISEGDNRRRMEAALVADAAMAEIELGLQSFVLPADGISEEEVDDFRIVTEVTPWTPPPELAEAMEEVAPRGTVLFGGRFPQELGLVREIAVRVEWFDGIEENVIERVTLGVNIAGITGRVPAGSP